MILNKANSAENFSVLAEAPDWIVVEKRAGVLCHPTKPNGPYTLWHSLRELLAFEIATGGKISLINRLDRETSGIVLVAKTSWAASYLARAMAAGLLHKEYLAIVMGWPTEDKFEVAQPILRLGEMAFSAVWLKRAVHPRGVPAQTFFRVEKRLVHPAAGRISLVRAIPITGRTHQVRVHLSHAGYPLIGDKLYGTSEGCYLQFIKEGWSPALQSVLHMPRQALHSTRMKVVTENLQAEWKSALPADMREFLQK